MLPKQKKPSILNVVDREDRGNNMINPNTFGKKVRYAREKAGLTHDQLAKKLDVSQSFISKMENDLRYPNHDKTILMAEILNMPIESLFSDNVNKEKYEPYLSVLDLAIVNDISPEELNEAILFITKIKENEG